MKYADGQEVRAGDRVKLWEGQLGTVVCSIDTGNYIKEFPQAEWAYLGRGVMIRTEDGGLFHYIEGDKDFELIRSAGTG